MKTLDEFFRDVWRWKIGVPVVNQAKITCKQNEANIRKYWLPFLTLQFNRLFMGAFRYGLICDPVKAKYDRVESIRKRLLKYEETGNAEHLVDVANLAFMEFVEGDHPHKHFAPIDDGEHTRAKHG
jgi:hypothetical protein